MPTVLTITLGAVVAVDFTLEDFSYDSVSLDTNNQGDGDGIFVKPDGTRLYSVTDNGDAVYQYTLSSGWDLSTASYLGVFFSVSGQDNAPKAVHFRDDGTRMFVLGDQTDSVYQYTLSSAWDVSTASYDSVSFSVNSEDNTPQGMFFRSNGTKMYICGRENDRVYQYTLSTPWDLSTASYDTVNLLVGPEDTNPTDIFISENGVQLLVCGGNNGNLYQYTMSTAWDLSTASYDNVSIADPGTIGPFSVFVGDSNTKMFILSATAPSAVQLGEIYQYSTA